MGGALSGGSGGTLTKGGAGGFGGVIVTAGTGGTLPDPDPRCPPHAPTGSCTTDQSGASCLYDYFTGCLCLPLQSSSGVVLGLCTKADPTCTTPTGGTGAGGSAAGGSSGGGVGGLSAKIAVPPQRVCSCANGAWTCNF